MQIFSFLGYTLTELFNLTIDDKLINKQIRLFYTSSDVSRRKNLVVRHNRVAKYLKKIQKQSPEVFCKKGVLKNFANFTGKHPCWNIFYNQVAGLQPAGFLKKDSNASNTSAFLSCEVCETFKNTASGGFYEKAALKNFAMFTRRKYLVISVL